MLNHQAGHDRGHDSPNPRGYNHYGANNQNQGIFPVGGNLPGLHNMSGSYALQNSLPQPRGLGNSGPQGQQGRFGGQNLPTNLQQYSQVANRGGLPLANGLTNQGMNRGNPSNSGKQAQRMQGSGLNNMGTMNQNLQRTGPQGMAAMNNMNQRNLQNLNLGGGNFGVHHLGSPARGNALGLSNYGTSNGPNSQAPSELLSLMGKSNQNQLGNLGQSFGQVAHQAGPSGAMQNSSQASAQDKESPAFDASEFPALGGTSRPANAKFANGERPSSLDGANLYSNLGMHKGMLPSEFNIQSEEFPALPGVASSARPATEDRQPADQSAQLANLRQEQTGRQDWHRDNTAALGAFSQHQSVQSRFAQNNAGNALQSSPSQPLRQIQDPRRSGRREESKLQDRFGLMGLLGVIRMQDADLTTLALGCDLTTLGLPLNSSDLVYKTFTSPWTENPSRHEPPFQVPECYRKPAPRLKPVYFERFQPDTLFYVFYSMPGDEAQIYAADELCRRGWGFHKEMKVWMQRYPGSEPNMKTAQLERGSFEVFDTSTWRRVQKDLVLHYELIERPPSLKRFS